MDADWHVMREEQDVPSLARGGRNKLSDGGSPAAGGKKRWVGAVGCDRLQLPRVACPNEPRSEQSAEDDVELDRFADDENTQDGATSVIGCRCAFRARLCAAKDIVSGRRY